MWFMRRAMKDWRNIGVMYIDCIVFDDAEFDSEVGF